MNKEFKFNQKNVYNLTINARETALHNVTQRITDKMIEKVTDAATKEKVFETNFFIDKELDIIGTSDYVSGLPETYKEDILASVEKILSGNGFTYELIKNDKEHVQVIYISWEKEK